MVAETVVAIAVAITVTSIIENTRTYIYICVYVFTTRIAEPSTARQMVGQSQKNTCGLSSCHPEPVHISEVWIGDMDRGRGSGAGVWIDLRTQA